MAAGLSDKHLFRNYTRTDQPIELEMDKSENYLHSIAGSGADKGVAVLFTKPMV